MEPGSLHREHWGTAGLYSLPGVAELERPSVTLQPKVLLLILTWLGG